MNSKFVTLAAAIVAGFGLIGSAQAGVVTYTLDHDGCTGTCGTGPFGTITTTDVATGDVKVMVSLNAGNQFHDTNDSQHHALVFDLTGAPTITISGLPSPFTANGSQVAGSISAAPFGKFEYVINYPHHSGGPAGLTSFSFDVLATGLTTADFISNGSVFFATDILGNNGKTGNVATTGPDGSTRGVCPPGEVGTPPNCSTLVVPEPMSLAILGSALLGLGAVLRRRSNKG